MKKKLALIFILVSNLCFSQDYKDSVAELLSIHPQPDSTQFFKIMNLNMNLMYDSPKEAIANYELLEKIASKQNYRAGVIWANTYNKFDPTSPFGGYKESGFGREGGLHGLMPYLSF